MILLLNNLQVTMSHGGCEREDSMNMNGLFLKNIIKVVIKGECYEEDLYVSSGSDDNGFYYSS